MMNKNIAVQDIYLLSDVKMLFEQQNCIETIVLQPFRIFRQICENIAHPAERFIFFLYKSTHLGPRTTRFHKLVLQEQNHYKCVKKISVFSYDTLKPHTWTKRLDLSLIFYPI